MCEWTNERVRSRLIDTLGRYSRKPERGAMIVSALRWNVLWMGLLVCGCASIMQTGDFTFTPLTEETFPQVEQTSLYRRGLGEPHRVIGEVSILGKPDESQETLEQRLIEAAGEVGVQGIILVEARQTVSELGEAGVRHDSFGGAAKQYRLYPSPIAIEEERIYIRGIAIRFMEE